MFYLVIAFICQAVTDRYYLVIDPFNVLEVALEEVERQGGGPPLAGTARICLHV